MVAAVHRIEASLLIPGRGEPIVDGIVLLDGPTITFAGAAADAPVSEGAQLGLFDAARHTRLNAALDAVRARFGDGALDRASAREVKERRRFSGQRYR